jgi:hypothetical protein
MKPSLASDCTRSVICAATVAALPMKSCRLLVSIISSRMDNPVASARSRQPFATAIGSRFIRTLARPLATVCSPTSGSTSGSGPSGS